MPIVSGTQPGLNATFWGINPCFNQLIRILSKRGVSVEPIQTQPDQSFISIGTPSIVIYLGEKITEGALSEKEVRDLKISYEPDKRLAQARVKPNSPDQFTKVSQVSNFAASYLRAHGYTVNVSIEAPEQLPDLDLDSGQIRFDQIDPNTIDPEVLRRELGLED